MSHALSIITVLKPSAVACLVLQLTFVSNLLADEPAHPTGDAVDFVRDIRPILSENCFFCHGPDAEQRQADLRLDTRSGLEQALTAGDRSDSEIYSRITTKDDDALMPPPDSNRTLTAEQKELIGNWIDSGALWQQHWSFRPIERPSIPELPPSNPKRGFPRHNAIDHFVQSRLQGTRLAPNPEADRRTLIRRVSLDLTGLPPTPDEVNAFLSDPSPDAYERLVDRLLDKPEFGERMAWEWLDAARYADTNGYQGDRERTMWPWRDWVVRSFNENMPFDRFTVLQLAGDLLPDATDHERLATAFCRNHMINGEGGRIADENRVEYVFDMAETTATVWLGLTLNCCRCHDHKYDPLTNENYYQLFAYFNQTPITGRGGDPQTAPVISVPNDEQRNRLEQLQAHLSKVLKELKQHEQRLAALQPSWEAEEVVRLSESPTWQRLQPISARAEEQTLELLDDHSVLASGKNPTNDNYVIECKLVPGKIGSLKLEALRDKRNTGNGLSRSSSGNFVLTDLRFAIVRDEELIELPIVDAEASFEQNGHPIKNAFDDDPKTGWAVYEGRVVDRAHQAILRFEQPIETRSGDRLRIEMRHNSPHQQHNIGRVRFAATVETNASLSNSVDDLFAALSIKPDARSAKQNQLLVQAHRASDSAYASLDAKRGELTAQRGALQKQLPKVMVMQDMAKPRSTFLLQRGLYNQPKAEVSAATPGFLGNANANEPQDRLSLARWIVSEENPLTARVTVNRFWQQLFGIGLVKTVEDFGAQGEIPQHMELLNWLSADFRASGWDVKALIRLIVTSHTYRQSSKRTPLQQEYDPENRLLSRGARFRLPSWMLRDQALAASGLLSETRHGPSTNTYQPPGVWEEATFGKKKYVPGTGEELYRRSLFIYWRRIIAPTMFFDAATRQTCTVKLTKTNTPLHALLTFNDTVYVESARKLAEQALLQPMESDEQRLDFVILRILSRPASQTERQILLKGLKRSRELFEREPESAAQLLEVGESSSAPSLNAAQHASWTTLCLAILNLDETLNRE